MKKKTRENKSQKYPEHQTLPEINASFAQMVLLRATQLILVCDRWLLFSARVSCLAYTLGPSASGGLLEDLHDVRVRGRGLAHDVLDQPPGAASRTVEQYRDTARRVQKQGRLLTPSRQFQTAHNTL